MRFEPTNRQLMGSSPTSSTKSPLLLHGNINAKTSYIVCDFKQYFGGFLQPIKKNRDPRWEEEFTFTLEEPPTTEKMHLEVVSTSKRMGLIHPKVQLALNFTVRYKVCLFNMSLCQESLGYIDINLADVVENKRINEKYHLIDSKNGKLQVELQWRASSQMDAAEENLL